MPIQSFLVCWYGLINDPILHLESCVLTEGRITRKQHPVYTQLTQSYVVVLYPTQWSKPGKPGERAVLGGMKVLTGSGLPSGNIQSSNASRSSDRRARKWALYWKSWHLSSHSSMSSRLHTSASTERLVTQNNHRKDSDRALSNHRLATLVNRILVAGIIFSTPPFVVGITIMANVTPLQQLWSLRRFAYRGPRRVVQTCVFLNSCKSTPVRF